MASEQSPEGLEGASKFADTWKGAFPGEENNNAKALGRSPFGCAQGTIKSSVCNQVRERKKRRQDTKIMGEGIVYVPIGCCKGYVFLFFVLFDLNFS